MDNRLKKRIFNKKLLTAVVFILIFVVLIYLSFPMLLCTAIQNQWQIRYSLIDMSAVFNVNRPTQPLFLDNITKYVEYTSTYPLIEACVAGDLPAVTKLLKKGADPNIGSLNDFSPLQSAYVSINGKNTLKIAQTLIEHGAEVDKKGGEYTALFLLMQRMSLYTPEEIMPHVQLLLDAGASPYDDYGNSMLFYCVLYNRPDILGAVIKLDVIDINHINDFDETALSRAYEYGYDECVEILLANGALE